MNKKWTINSIQYNASVATIFFFCENGDFHMQCALLASCLLRHTWCWCELFDKKWFLIEKSALCQTNIFPTKFLWSLWNWRTCARPVHFLQDEAAKEHCLTLRSAVLPFLKGHINVVWPPKMRMDYRLSISFTVHIKKLFILTRQSKLRNR